MTAAGPLENPRLYRTWLNMRSRCNNPRATSYRHYGGRGISVCAEWATWVAFRDWAYAHGWREDLTLERIDTDGNYEPSNCRWATVREQGRNTRANVRLTAFGEAKTVVEWAEDARCSVQYDTLAERIRSGWDHERAITTAPVTPSGRGPAHSGSKVTAADIPIIRRRFADGDTQTDIAADYGVTKHAIYRIVHRQTWQHVPDPEVPVHVH